MTPSLTGTLLRGIRDQAPVPFVARTGGLTIPFLAKSGQEQQMAAMGSNGVLFAIITRTSTAVASAQWHLWRKAASGLPEDRIEVTDHLAKRIWEKPNPFYSGYEFREVAQQHLDLAGETPWVVARDPRSRLPLELWPVRPDRVTPIPSPTDYLTGYVYTSADGEKIPLGLDEVIFTRTPNPLDPYRGMAPVQAVMTDIESLRYSREWNRNFFMNSAEPGGIIQVDKRLSDDEFDEMTRRWREQHQGVARAHRVAVIEQGQWIDRKITQRDMEFSALAALSVEQIRMAYSFPKPLLGSVDDVNLANAKAAQVDMARNVTVPRLDRIKGALNNDFLPLFGPTTQGLEFDYDTPVPEDEEAENARWIAQSTFVAALVPLGYDDQAVLEAVGLPAIPFEKPEVPAPVIAPPPGQGQGPAAHYHRPRHLAPRAASTPQDLPPEQLPDISHAQTAWEAALAGLLVEWGRVAAGMKDHLVHLIRDIVASGSRVGLTQLQLDAADAAAAVHAAMVDLAAQSAVHVVGEAAAQGVTIAQGVADVHRLADIAQTAAILQTQDLEASAAREALRVWGPSSHPDAVAEQVGTALNALTDAGPARTFGGALSEAQHDGRVATLRLAPSGAIYADERMDRNTCAPCAEINGRWLCNTDDMAPLELTYPSGGYIGCLGRDRCRGTVTGIWRPRQVAE